MPSSPKASPELAKATSVFLDLLRIAAALTVFLYHCRFLWFEYDEQSGKLVHRAVIVFFVLSGFVIACSTFQKRRDLRHYAVARFSRLYSVVAPALLLTLVLNLLGQAVNPGFYLKGAHGHEAIRYLCSAFFLQAVWDSHIVPSTNVVFWSLGYEFWYYVLFGIVVLVDSRKWKVMLALATVVFVGPGILLLLPCWLAGVVIYLCIRRGALAPFWAGIGFVFFALTFAMAVFNLPDFPMKPGLRPFLYSNGFLGDSLIAMILAGTIWFFDQAFFSVSIPSLLVKAIRFLADHTFSLYLYHFPLVFFVRAVIPFHRDDPGQVVAMTGAVLMIVLLLSLHTESKRPQWAQAFDWLWGKIIALSR